jgi:hypothetical protein
MSMRQFLATHMRKEFGLDVPGAAIIVRYTPRAPARRARKPWALLTTLTLIHLALTTLNFFAAFAPRP